MTAPDTPASSFGTFFDPDPDDERLGFGLIHSHPRLSVDPGWISLALARPSLAHFNCTMQASPERLCSVFSLIGFSRRG